MSFSRSYTQAATDYRLNGVRLQEVDKIKDLGITIDNKLTFDSHVNKITLQAYKIMGLITRTGRDFSSAYPLVRLFLALVLPIVEYGTVIWSPFPSTQVNRIEKVQHKFCESLLYLNLDRINIVTTDEVRSVFGLNKLINRRKIADLVFFFKIFNSLINATDIYNSFEFIDN